jgi:hypothetical protein
MERTQPPPFADLASAWRRISYSQADRGQTPESIASIARSIAWARRYVEANRTADAASQLAESLFDAALLQQRRGSIAKAGELAAEGVRLLEPLPESVRAPIERTPPFVRASWLAARRLAAQGDIDGGRALLRRSIDASRRTGRLAQLRATLDLVWLEHRAGDERRIAATCDEARSIGVTTPRLAKLCGPVAESTRADLEAAVARESVIFERQLLVDPERYGFRLQLARRKLQLARFAGENQDTPHAVALLEEARTLAEDLVRADPDNQILHNLLARIERVGTRIASQ